MRGMKQQPGHASVLGVLAIGLLIATTSALADHARAETNSYSDYARVVDVEPIIRRSYQPTPEKICNYQPNYKTRVDHRRQHQHNTVPRLVGGLIGGLIGSQFGGGRGKTALTFAGAVTGAAIAESQHSAAGNQHYARDRYAREECRTVTYRRLVEEVDGYQVTYRYKGQTFVRTMDEDPGNRVRIRVNVMPFEDLPDSDLNRS